MLKSRTANDIAVGKISENLQRQNMKLQVKMSKLRQQLQGSFDSEDVSHCTI